MSAWMQTVTNTQFLRRYAQTTPGGLHDPQASRKLWHEFGEFLAEIVRLRLVDAATESADIRYYHAKLPMSVAWVAGLVPLVLSNLLIGVLPPLGGWLARAKYTSRGAYGKDKAREYAAVRRVLIALWACEIAIALAVFAATR